MPPRSSHGDRNGPVITGVSEEAADAVRRYLDLVRDPSVRWAPEDLVDVPAIRSSVDDPLEALKLVGKALADAAAVEDPESAFIRYAKTWALHNGIGRDVFRAFGVKPEVLTKAFGEPTEMTTRPSVGTRINVDELIAAIKNKPRGTVLTVAGIIAEFGGSVATVRKVVEQLTRSGALVRLGPDPTHHGPGRATIQFERA
jgi:hypothetical protein